MKKITILSLHLGYGGVEKCISMLSNSLVDDYEIEIVSNYRLYDKIPFKLDDKIKVKYLMLDKTVLKVERYKHHFKHLNFVLLFKELFNDYLKKLKIKELIIDTFNSIKTVFLKKKLMINYIKNCNSDIIISTKETYNGFLGKYGNKNSLKIGWEHNHHNNNQKYINKVLKSIKNLDYFILVSSSLQKFYQEKTSVKCIYIPNALDEYPNKYSSLLNKSIISIGRLSYEKGYDDLIEVYRLVNTKYPDWNLNIIGDGVEKSKIEEKIKKYNLSNNVFLHGYQDKEYINEMLFNSSIYVMPSRSESFGLVLLEAFSYGLPCVAFDRASGASNIISDNWDGYLVKDSNIEQMAKRICGLIKNTNRRVIMGANGIKKANQYNIKIIKKEWIKIIEK